MDRYPDIRDLQLLIALAQRKHFTQAASDCGISQPAFSARIRALETELGVPVVRRGNKFLGFTRDGELLLRWARKILADAEGLRQDIEVSKGALQGALVLGVVPTALPYAASVSTTLRARFTELTIQIQSLTSTQIARGLTDFSLDAGITYHDEREMAPLRFESIYNEHYVLLSPMHLAPRIKGRATWAEAAALPLCLLSKDMRFRQIVDEVFLTAGVTAQPVMETNAFTAALVQVTNGSAATIAPQKLIDSLFLDQNSISLQLEAPTVQNSIGLATLDYEPTLPAIDALREIIGIHDK
jgi:DNA-binding transcriptional LysR family regulator